MNYTLGISLSIYFVPDMWLLISFWSVAVCHDILSPVMLTERLRLFCGFLSLTAGLDVSSAYACIFLTTLVHLGGLNPPWPRALTNLGGIWRRGRYPHCPVVLTPCGKKGRLGAAFSNEVTQCWVVAGDQKCPFPVMLLGELLHPVHKPIHMVSSCTVRQVQENLHVLPCRKDQWYLVYGWGQEL